MSDKEKQINISTKEEIETRNKTGKEKDELKQALLHYATAEASGGIKTLIDCEGCAFYLYEILGYRKPVVLTKEEYSRLYNNIAKFKKITEKQTAEKILNECDKLLHKLAMEYANTGHITYFAVCENVHHSVLSPLAKQLGVEIKE